MRTLLVIDDEPQMRLLVQSALHAVGYRVLTAASGKEGFRLLDDQIVNLVLVDILMPGMDGLVLIRRLCSARPTSKIIAMSAGTGEWNYLHVAKQLGAHATLQKPFGLQELLEAVRSQLPT